MTMNSTTPCEKWLTELRETLSYNPQTGAFTWLKWRGRRATWREVSLGGSVMEGEPYFYAEGAWVEDRRDNRPAVCYVFFGDEGMGFMPDGSRVERSYDEACKLAIIIADALNTHYPNCNNKRRAKK